MLPSRNLGQAIAQAGFAADDVIALSKTGQLTAGQAVALGERVPPALVGASAAMKLSDPLDFVAILLALDGRAAEVTILSGDLPDDVTRAVLDLAGSPVLIRSRDAVAGEDARAGSEARDTVWRLTTSGTTGVPKLVTHGFANLCRSAKPPRPGAVRPVWGLLYEPSRFAGLQVLIQSFVGGGRLLLTSSDDDLRDRLAFLAENGCTHLSATPSIWRKILMAPEAGRLRLQQATLGGEVADDRVLAGLRNRFPDARVTHIYASTEVGVGFAVNDGRAGFPASYLDAPQQGLDLKVEQGLLWIKPRADLPRPAGTHIKVDDAGFVCTEDLVERRDDRIHFLGRASSVVNVGGVKLQLEQLETKLRTHPQVAECAFFAKSNPITGAILSLVVVPAGTVDDEKAFKRELKSWCRTNLQPEAVPATIEMVQDLALSSSGKLRRVR